MRISATYYESKALELLVQADELHGTKEKSLAVAGAQVYATLAVAAT